MVEMKGEERGWRRISSRLFPSQGPGLGLCKMWITRACTPRGREDPMELCRLGAQPRYSHGHVLPLPVRPPTCCLPRSYARISTCFVPIGSLTPPPAQPTGD